MQGLFGKKKGGHWVLSTFSSNHNFPCSKLASPASTFACMLCQVNCHAQFKKTMQKMLTIKKIIKSYDNKFLSVNDEERVRRNSWD